MDARVDLNADLGEGFGPWRMTDDEGLLAVVTSANIACGFHAGDPSTMRRVCAAAVERGVAIGAQVSYPDLVGFGRRFVDMDHDELRDTVLYQLGALTAMATAAGGSVTYLKPHGALYHAVADGGHQAEAVLDAVRRFDERLAVVGRAGSLFGDLTRSAGLRFVAEGFADRGYRADGTLVPRREEGAIVDDPAAVVDRSVRLASERRIRAVSGDDVTVEVASICVHGDTPGAVHLARAVRDALERSGVHVTPFAPHPSPS